MKDFRSSSRRLPGTGKGIKESDGEHGSDSLGPTWGRQRDSSFTDSGGVWGSAHIHRRHTATCSQERDGDGPGGHEVYGCRRACAGLRGHRDSQAEALDETLEDIGRGVGKALAIMVKDDELVRRLTGRRVCKDCQTPFHMVFNPPAKEGVCDACCGELQQRDDDSEETVKNRLSVYREQTEPLIGYY